MRNLALFGTALGGAALIAVVGVAVVWAASQTSMQEMSPPVLGLKATELRDTFDELHSGHAHEAIDIMVARGTPVHAVVTGRIVKLFLSKAGGMAIYEFDQAGEYCYYYAHLDGYADGLKDGAQVGRGDVIGFAGSTGNARADAPHLHFAVFELGPEKVWWKGKAINPFQALVAAVQRGK